MSHRERSDEISFCSPLLTCRIVRDLMKPHSAPLYWHVGKGEQNGISSDLSRCDMSVKGSRMGFH